MRILTVYAHPDDESFGPAAALAKYARGGAALYGVWATRGEHGPVIAAPPPPAEEVASLREQDLRQAAALIGYRELEFLGYHDGELAAVARSELESRVYHAIARWRPDVVLTFGPGGITHHPDHVAVSYATTAAFYLARMERTGARELFYDAVPRALAEQFNLTALPDGNPNTRIDVAACWPIKLDAMRIHARHMRDARERLPQLEQQSRSTALFYREWPQPPAAEPVTGFGTTPGP